MSEEFTIGVNGCMYRKGKVGKKTCVPQPIDTIRGKLTRREIANLAGIPLNTVHSRLFNGIVGEELFLPAGKVTKKSGRKMKAAPKKGQRHTNKHLYFESWADIKKRKAKEREQCLSK